MKNKFKLDSKRFKWMDRKKRKWLQGLDLEKAVKLQKSLLEFYEHKKHDYLEDNPVCYKMLLRGKQ